VILGQYDLSVRKGQVTLMGATLPPSKVSHHVYAPSSHALPVIRCLATDVYGADIRLRQCDNGLRSLDALSPLYGKLWNDNCGPLGAEYQHILGGRKESTFQIVRCLQDCNRLC
jgi:polynucleotide 5'-hydroxyl-kinase GRC3/NOL9